MLRRIASLVLLLACSMLEAAPIKLVTGPDYAPFTDPALPSGGIATELVIAAFQKAGEQTALEWRPWSNGYHATLKGEFVATFPYMRTHEREKIFLYSEPLFDLKFYVFGHTGAALDGRNLASLKGHRYCQPLGWALLPAIDAMVKSGDLLIQRPNDMTACLKLIAAGHSDFTITDKEQGLRSIAKTAKAQSDIVPLGGQMDSLSLHLIVPRALPNGEEILKRFNQGLQAVRVR